MEYVAFGLLVVVGVLLSGGLTLLYRAKGFVETLIEKGLSGPAIDGIIAGIKNNRWRRWALWLRGLLVNRLTGLLYKLVTRQKAVVGAVVQLAIGVGMLVLLGLLALAVSLHPEIALTTALYTGIGSAIASAVLMWFVAGYILDASTEYIVRKIGGGAGYTMDKLKGLAAGALAPRVREVAKEGCAEMAPAN